MDPGWGDVGNSAMQRDAGGGPSSTNPVKELKQSFRQEHFFSHLLQLEQDEPNQLDPLHAECSPGLPCSLTLLSFPSKLSLYSKLFFVCFTLLALEVMFIQGTRGRLKPFGHPQGICGKCHCERSFPRLLCQHMPGSCRASPLMAEEEQSLEAPLFP